MEKTLPVKYVAGIFVSGLAISMMAMSPFLLDLALVPRFICLAVTLIVAMFILSSSGNVFRFEFDLVTTPLLCYALFCFTSIAWSVNKAEALFEASRNGLFLLTFFITYNILTFQKEKFLAYFSKAVLVIVLLFIAVAIPQFTSKSGSGKEALYEVSSMNGHKNLFASFLFLGLFYLITAYTFLKGPWKIAVIVTIFITLLTLMLLQTRAVWVALFILLLMLLVLSQMKVKVGLKRYGWFLFVLCLILINLFFLFVLPHLIDRVITLTKDGQSQHLFLDEERLLIWQKTYWMINRHFFAGVGAGNWQVFFPDASLSGMYRAEDLNFTFQRPHNDLLWIFSETGWLGFNLILFFAGSLIFYLLRSFRSSESKSQIKTELMLCLSFIAAYYTIAFFDFPKERIEHGILINVIFAIAYYLVKSQTQVLSFRGFNLKTLHWRLALLLPFVTLCLGLLRYKGEYYNRLMLDARNSGALLKAAAAGNSALSFVYTLDPTSVPIDWYVGNIDAMLPGKGDEVLTRFRAAHRQNPYNRNVLNDLASAEMMNGNVEAAKRHYIEASRISPRFDEPKLNLVAIYINEQNYEAAALCLQSIFHDSERRTQYQKIVDAFRGKK